MSILYNVIGGLLTVVITELFRRYYYKRKQHQFKTVFGLDKNRECFIYIPIYPDKPEERRLKYKNSYALGHILNATSQLNVNTQIIPSDENEPESSEKADIISIGGLSNEYTKRIIDQYNINYKFENTSTFRGIKIKDNQYPVTKYKEPAIILKLDKKFTKEGKTIILIIGYTAQGTSSAAYFMLKEYKKIYKAFKNDSFAILIHTDRKGSYKNYNEDFEDITFKTIFSKVDFHLFKSNQ
jgi:hypothetical protein